MTIYIGALALAVLLLVWVWPSSGPQPGDEVQKSMKKATRRAVARRALRPGEQPSTAGVAGTVREAGGDPLPNVRLTFRLSGQPTEVTSDGAGGYHLVLAPGRYRLELSADGFIGVDEMDLEVEPGEKAKPVDFTLYRAARVGGRVIDPRGQPVAGAQVRIHRVRSGRRFAVRRLQTTTDANGRFHLMVPPSEVVLRADHGRLGSTLGPPLYLAAGADASGVQLQLGLGLSLAGQVIGPGQQRVEQGEVTLSDELGSRTVRCDSDGRFELAGLTAGRKLLQARAPGFSASQVKAAAVDARAGARIVLALSPLRVLAGKVVDAEEQPMPGARVTARPGSPGREMAQLLPPLAVKTDAEGGFELSGVPDLPLLVVARGPGNSVAQRAGVAPNEKALILRLQQTGGVVGRVTDARTGRPVVSFVARLQGQGSPVSRRFISATGRYHLADLRPGRYELSLAAPGYAPVFHERLGVIGGADIPADAALEPAGEVTGHVVDRAGRPLAGASVRLTTGWAGDQATADAEGAFALHDVGAGRRSLEVANPGFDSQILPLQVVIGQTAKIRVELRRRRGRRPAIRLTGIGAVLTWHEGQLTVTRALPGSPAAVARLQAGDLILRIAGRAVDQRRFGDAIEAIRGLAGTPVHLEIRRGEQTFNLNVIRAEISVPNG
jgi:hypothetical protein